MEEIQNQKPKKKPVQLLCVFVHGFKGDDTTFSGFPERLQHILTSSIDNGLGVECLVFPAYETRGDLSQVTERFVDWLTTIVVEKEVANGEGGGAGKTKIVLLGHSMGGLLIADSLLAIASSSQPTDSATPLPSLWPRIIACLAFDTPYYGLHPFVFKNSASKAVGYVQTAHALASGLGLFGALGGIKAGTQTQSNPSTPPNTNTKDKEAKEPDTPPILTVATNSTSTSTSSATTQTVWSKWAAPALYGIGGAALAGAAAGTAYYKRQDLSSGLTWAGSWASDHLKYVGNLWDEKSLRMRVDGVLKVAQERGLVFHNFYTHLPEGGSYLSPRTFIIVPRATSTAFQYHSPNINTIAADEIAAHTGMFEPQMNDGFYELGLKTAELIGEAMEETNRREKETEGSST